jgi:hypothetical protein
MWTKMGRGDTFLPMSGTSFTHDDLLSAAVGTVGRDYLRVLLQRFSGKELGRARTVLGVDIARDRKAKTITIHQPKLIAQMMESFDLPAEVKRTSPLLDYIMRECGLL